MEIYLGRHVHSAHSWPHMEDRVPRHLPLLTTLLNRWNSSTDNYGPRERDPPVDKASRTYSKPTTSRSAEYDGDPNPTKAHPHSKLNEPLSERNSGNAATEPETDGTISDLPHKNQRYLFSIRLLSHTRALHHIRLSWPKRVK